MLPALPGFPGRSRPDRQWRNHLLTVGSLPGPHETPDGRQRWRSGSAPAPCAHEHTNRALWEAGRCALSWLCRVHFEIQRDTLESISYGPPAERARAPVFQIWLDDQVWDIARPALSCNQM